MLPILVTLDTFQLLTFNSNVVALLPAELNIPLILVTIPVFQPFIFPIDHVAALYPAK